MPVGTIVKRQFTLKISSNPGGDKRIRLRSGFIPHSFFEAKESFCYTGPNSFGRTRCSKRPVA